MTEPMPEIEAPEHPQQLLAPPPANRPPKSRLWKSRSSHHRRWVYAAILVILALAGAFLVV